VAIQFSQLCPPLNVCSPISAPEAWSNRVGLAAGKFPFANEGEASRFELRKRSKRVSMRPYQWRRGTIFRSCAIESRQQCVCLAMRQFFLVVQHAWPQDQGMKAEQHRHLGGHAPFAGWRLERVAIKRSPVRCHQCRTWPRMAEATGFRAIYPSVAGGGGGANSLGLPILGLSGLEDGA